MGDIVEANKYAIWTKNANREQAECQRTGREDNLAGMPKGRSGVNMV